MQKGEKLKLENATILRIKDKVNYYNGHCCYSYGFLIEDPKHGKVWFKTTAKPFVELVGDPYGTSEYYQVNIDQPINCEVTVSGSSEDIIFAKRPCKLELRAF